MLLGYIDLGSNPGWALGKFLNPTVSVPSSIKRVIMMAVKIKWDKARKSFNSLPSKIITEPDMLTKSKQKTLGPCLHIGMWLFTYKSWQML